MPEVQPEAIAMTPNPLPPENASPEELRAYYRAVADAAMAAVLAGLALPSTP